MTTPKVAMFENGEVDAIEQISSQYFGHLNEYLNSFVGGGIMFLWINQQGTSPETAALLSNQNFRQALNYGFRPFRHRQCGKPRLQSL